jgi:UDP-2,3-diacylglucosamine pyrophosphatase LpxH
MACRANILRTEMPLEKELAAYEKMKTDLLKTYEGKFVVIHGDEFCGAFDTAENAYAEGVKRFGREPFLMKKVVEKEEVYRNQALSLGLMHAGI